MNTNDFGAAGQLLADGYRLECPQSGETVRGRDNFARLNQSYPANGVWRSPFTGSSPTVRRSSAA